MKLLEGFIEVNANIEHQATPVKIYVNKAFIKAIDYNGYVVFEDGTDKVRIADRVFSKCKVDPKLLR